MVDTISNAIDTVQKTFVTSEEPASTEVPSSSSSSASTEVPPSSSSSSASTEVPSSASTEEPVQVQMKTGGK